MRSFTQPCSSSQDCSWYGASRGPSAAAETLVRNKQRWHKRFDYCNAVFHGAPSYSINKLRAASTDETNAARIVLKTMPHQHVAEDVTLAARSAEDRLQTHDHWSDWPALAPSVTCTCLSWWPRVATDMIVNNFERERCLVNRGTKEIKPISGKRLHHLACTAE